MRQNKRAPQQHGHLDGHLARAVLGAAQVHGRKGAWERERERAASEARDSARTRKKRSQSGNTRRTSANHLHGVDIVPHAELVLHGRPRKPPLFRLFRNIEKRQ